ncbi:hypothetical protein NMY22_g19847 [Coprinellus aureogranulatus]|nr:hypothetical protein NMY22_g19847 [Coprinellus aureogranulatus]
MADDNSIYFAEYNPEFASNAAPNTGGQQINLGRLGAKAPSRKRKPKEEVKPRKKPGWAGPVLRLDIPQGGLVASTVPNTPGGSQSDGSVFSEQPPLSAPAYLEGRVSDSIMVWSTPSERNINTEKRPGSSKPQLQRMTTISSNPGSSQPPSLPFSGLTNGYVDTTKLSNHTAAELRSSTSVCPVGFDMSGETAPSPTLNTIPVSQQTLDYGTRTDRNFRETGSYSLQELWTNPSEANVEHRIHLERLYEYGDDSSDDSELDYA